MASPDFSALTVRTVEYATARDMIVANHYSHKWNTALFGTHNVGVFQDETLLGVAVYGYAMNPRGWARVTRTPAEQCVELNRLWIDDCLGANTETWLMGRSFRSLRAEGIQLVQSFADGRLGVGTIYQAANFTYHGFHMTRFHRDSTTGEVLHDTPFRNTAQAAPMVGRNLLHAQGRLETFEVRTYRYLYPLNKSARRAVLLPAQPYPKERVGARVIDYTPPPGQIARSAALADALGRTADAATLSEYLNTITDDAAQHIAAQRQNRWVQALLAA